MQAVGKKKKRTEKHSDNNANLHGKNSIKCFNESLTTHQQVAMYLILLPVVYYWLALLSLWGEELSGWLLCTKL